MFLRNFQLNWLRTFEAAGRLLSFSQAARQLNMSQSAVSQQIGLLEHRVGAKLFVRRRRAIELTISGLAYLTLVQQALQHVEHGMESIFNTAAQGVLELSVNNTFAQFWLAPRLKRFTDLHPRVSLRMYGKTWETEAPLGSAELEIRYGNGQWPGLEATGLLPPGLRPYCSKSMAAEVRNNDLLGLPLIDVLATPVGWSEWIAQHSCGKRESFERLYVDSYAIAADMAASGMGVCLMNDELVNGSRIGTVLVSPMTQRGADGKNFFLLRQRGRSISGAERAFAAWLSAERAMMPAAINQ